MRNIQRAGYPLGPRFAFTLMEMLVSFAMLVILLVAVLVIFERSARIGRDQTEVAAIQQSSRIAHSEILRHARMAGAGGLPLTWKSLPADPADMLKIDSPGAFPSGFAVAIHNDAPEGYSLPVGPAATHTVVPHSDILTVRGAFTLPVYYYYPEVQTEGWNTGTEKIAARALEIPNRMGRNFRTALEPLKIHLDAMKAAGKPVLFVVRDLMNPDAYSVLKWNDTSGANDLNIHDCTTIPDVTGTQGSFDVGCITVAVELLPDQRYAMLGLGTNLATDSVGVIALDMPGVPRGKVAFPAQIGSIAVLQEYRYYVRAEFEVPGDSTSRLSPVLTRTEYFPSTEIDPLPEDFIETIDVVNNLIDLQIAAGIDQDFSVTAAEHGIVTDLGNDQDEIVFNDANDMAEPPTGLSRFDGLGVPEYRRWFHPKLDVYFLRITTVAQSQRPEREFAGTGIARVEDCDRSVDFMVSGATFNYNNDRKYRRRLLQSIAELRNLK